MPRNNRIICYTFVVFSAVLTGCASHSGVVPMGPDTYFISRQAATGFTGMGTLKAEAFGEAGAYCSRQGKTAQVISEQDAQPPFVLGNFPKTEIKFRCVNG
jgi:hypothetical protein